MSQFIIQRIKSTILTFLDTGFGISVVEEFEFFATFSPDGTHLILVFVVVVVVIVVAVLHLFLQFNDELVHFSILRGNSQSFVQIGQSVFVSIAFPKKDQR